MSKKPLIGLFPSYDEKELQQTVYMRYVRAIQRAGGAPFVLPLTEDVAVMQRMVEACDGVLFTGGDDMHPRYYGCCLHEHCGELALVRDKAEVIFANEFLKTDKPFLGICRGIQFINVMYGGTLYQDIAAEYKAGCIHRQPRPFNVPFHEVKLTKGGKLYEICGAETIQVNSMHHQSVKKLGAGLVAEGYAPDGVFEALSATDREYGIGVQWHPEHLVEKDNEAALRIFTSFIEAATTK